MSVLVQNVKDLQKVIKVMKDEGVSALRCDGLEIQMPVSMSPFQMPPMPSNPPKPLTKEQRERERKADLFNTDPISEGA